jgi:hypothetical protein
MTSIRWSAAALVLAALVGCSLTAHSISGAYIAPSTQSVELLQLTQSSDGQLLGSLQHYEIKADGTPLQQTLNVSGSVDGKSLTLIFKLNEPLSVAANVSGLVDSGVITLNWPAYSERFVASTPDAFQAAVAQLSAKGQAVYQSITAAKRVADENAKVVAVTNELNAYSAKIEATNAGAEPYSRFSSGVHEQLAKILDAARKDLDIEARLKAGDGMHQAQGGQVQARIGQLNAQLTMVNIPYLQSAGTWRQHIQQFDAALASSPCMANTRPSPIPCTDESAAEQRYLAVRSTVLQRADELEAAVKDSAAAMESVNKQAGN